MSQREPILHWNIGGPRGWTTACGIESSSFTDKEDEREDVDCKRCLKAMNREFIVTGSYATWSGNFGSFRYVIHATDESETFDKAKARLVADKRRQYMGKLDMSASPA